MANRRMFALSVTDSDDFQSMPLSTQAIYFHLAMHADDDGFVGSPKRILRGLGGSDDEVKLLVAKGYVIPFNSGVCVIRHWKINNQIKNDRYSPTIYSNEMKSLEVSDNKSYKPMDPKWIQNGSTLDPKVSIGELSIGEESGDAVGKPTARKVFEAPTVDEVAAYCKERLNNIDAEYFCAYYEARGWELGKGKKMKDWKSAIITWEKRDKERKQTQQTPERKYGFDL